MYVYTRILADMSLGDYSVMALCLLAVMCQLALV